MRSDLAINSITEIAAAADGRRMRHPPQKRWIRFRAHHMAVMSPGGWGFQFGWTGRDESFGGRGWMDPLGLRTEVDRIASAIVPLFRKRHKTLVQFGLLCFAIEQAKGDRELFHRVEHLWSLTCADRSDESPWRWPGRRKAKRVLLDGLRGRQVDLDTPLLGNERVGGLWGGNRHVAAQLGLVTPRDRTIVAVGPCDYALTAAGRQLATVFRQAFVADTAGLRRAVRTGFVTVAMLRDILQLHPEGEGSLAPVITSRIEVRPREWQMAMALRQAWCQRSLAPSEIPLRQLTTEQRSALVRARAVNELIHVIERPFRQWYAGGEVDPPDEIWGHPVWTRPGVPGVSRALQKAGMSTPGAWEGVLRHARRQFRGGQLLERGQMPEAWSTARREDFRLPTFARLLDQGLMGDG